MPRRSAVRPAARALPLGPALRRAYGLTAAALTGVALTASAAFATGPAMPWDGPLNNILDNLSGPTARVLVLLAIVGTGLMWAFTRNEEGLKKIGQIAFGGSIAMGAVTMLASLGLTAGAVL